MGIESMVSVDTTPKPMPQPYLLDDCLGLRILFGNHFGLVGDVFVGHLVLIDLLACEVFLKPNPLHLGDTLRPCALAVPSGDTPRRRTLPCAFLPVAGLYADRPRVNVACLDAHTTLRNHLDDLGVELMLDLMFWSSVILTGNKT